MFRVFAIGVITLLSATVLLAQTACPSTPPLYSLLRENDDQCYLKNSTCRTDLSDRLKFISIGANEDRFLSVGGEVREWYEGMRNPNWGREIQDDNGYLLQRLTTYADFHAAPRVRFFVQLTSAIEAGRKGGPRPGVDESKLSFENGFVDIALSKRRERSFVSRLGRQEFKFGSGRLVDVREGTNVRRAFDGVSLKWKSPSWTVDGFVVKPLRTGTGVMDTPPEHGTTFWGTYAVHPLHRIKHGNIDLYYLGLARRDAAFEKGIQNELRHTVGARFWGELSGWTYNSEAIFQWGTFGLNDVRAWSTGHDFNYTFRSVRLQPVLGIDAGIASGDHGDSKSALGTFSALFPTGFYYGQGALGLNGPSNVISFGPHFGLHLAKSLYLVMDNHSFWRASLQDGVYGLGINLIVPGRGNPERFLGNKPTIGLYWNPDRHLEVSAAYAHFLTGPFLTKAFPVGKDVDYAAVWTTYKF